MMLIALVAMAKKKSYVWQQTLGGSKAVEWLKPGMQVVAEKLTFGLGTDLIDLGFNIQDWNLEKNCVLIWYKGGVMPLLCASQSVVNFFGEVANEWLEKGSAKSVVSKDNTDTIGRPDEAKEFLYKLDRGAGQFDPYFVEVEEVQD